MGSIIENIKHIRRQKGISQESLAYDLGIDYSTYGKIERGQISLTVDRLEKIARILKVTVEEIYRWEGKEVKESLLSDKYPERLELSNCLIDLEAARKEVDLLKQQLKDKEKIIQLLENKQAKA